jgi:hypothetical protein
MGVVGTDRAAENACTYISIYIVLCREKVNNMASCIYMVREHHHNSHNIHRDRVLYRY